MEALFERDLQIGSHVRMRGSRMMLGAVEEALSYRANTFMVYTGAPQNARRKPIGELRIPEAQALMEQNNIRQFVVHAPYLINLGNVQNPEIFRQSVTLLLRELERTKQMGSRVLILHPGAHVGAGIKAGIQSIAAGLNEALSVPSDVCVALETMAGKGSEIGSRFEELADIFDRVRYPDRLRICFDTCHVHDAGYDIKTNPEQTLAELDHYIGQKQIAVFHINDSKNERGSRKDRHANIGKGQIGAHALYRLVHDPGFPGVPRILETPWYPDPADPQKSLPPYRQEIAWLQSPQNCSAFLDTVSTSTVS